MIDAVKRLLNHIFSHLVPLWKDVLASLVRDESLLWWLRKGLGRICQSRFLVKSIGNFLLVRRYLNFVTATFSLEKASMNEATLFVTKLTVLRSLCWKLNLPL